MKNRVIVPGTFDPITLGHVDIIERAYKIFGDVVIAIASSPLKENFFSINERVALIKRLFIKRKNIEVISFKNLLIKSADQYQCNIIIRGLRVFTDFEYELQMNYMNRKLGGTQETFFLSPKEKLSCVSSRMVREIVFHGGDIAKFVPKIVAKAIFTKLPLKLHLRVS